MSAPHTIPRPRTETRTRALSQTGRTVAVGTDESYWGRLALSWAVDHAWRRAAELEVYTAPAPAERDPLDFGGIGGLLREHPLLPVHVRTSHDAVAALVTASTRSELVVLGCRGHWHQGLTLGEAVLPVVARSRCDVLVVRGRATAVRGTNGTVTVLLGGPDDDRAVLTAARLAESHQSRLRVERAVATLGGTRSPEPPEDLLAGLDAAVELVARTAPGVAAVPRLVQGNAHELAASCYGTDVLVLSGGHRGALTPEARAALHNAPCPVLVTR